MDFSLFFYYIHFTDVFVCFQTQFLIWRIVFLVDIFCRHLSATYTRPYDNEDNK